MILLVTNLLFVENQKSENLGLGSFFIPLTVLGMSKLYKRPTYLPSSCTWQEALGEVWFTEVRYHLYFSAFSALSQIVFLKICKLQAASAYL